LGILFIPHPSWLDRDDIHVADPCRPDRPGNARCPLADAEPWQLQATLILGPCFKFGKGRQAGLQNNPHCGAEFK
jgi:hypothetical protein